MPWNDFNTSILHTYAHKCGIVKVYNKCSYCVDWFLVVVILYAALKNFRMLKRLNLVHQSWNLGTLTLGKT